MVELIFFIFGLIVGSFLNVVILRLDTIETIINTRSHCPNCKKDLAWYDLIPLISFFISRGRCRNCAKPISWQYPIVEALTGILFVLIYLNSISLGLSFGWQIAYIAVLVLLVCAMIVIFFYDLYKSLIPDEIIGPAIIIAGIFFSLLGYYTQDDSMMAVQRVLLGGVIGAGVPALLAVPSKEKWMGYGDITLGALIGLILGYPMVLAGLFVAFVSGGLIGSALVLSGSKKMKSAVPFGPFLIFGALTTLFYGKELIDWYLSFFIIGY